VRSNARSAARGSSTRYRLPVSDFEAASTAASLERVPVADSAQDESVQAEPAPAEPVEQRLGPLSNLARRGKVRFFLSLLPQDAQILDVGCSDNWFKRAAAKIGWTNVTGLDLHPPADVVGDVFEWRSLGLEPHSFDAIVAFEVLEHGDFALPIWELLKPDGVLMATTPIPRMDPFCRFMERLHLLQQRTSPHSHLLDLRDLQHFEVEERRVKAGISQWAVLRPLQAVADR
jgi:SAM-dependent methyltransferase